MGVHSFLVVCSNRRRDNGQKLEGKKLHSNSGKKFFTVKVMEHWNRLPGELVASPSLEILKTYCYATYNWLPNSRFPTQGPYQPL